MWGPEEGPSVGLSQEMGVAMGTAGFLYSQLPFIEQLLWDRLCAKCCP